MKFYVAELLFGKIVEIYGQVGTLGLWWKRNLLILINSVVGILKSMVRSEEIKLNKTEFIFALTIVWTFQPQN